MARLRLRSSRLSPLPVLSPRSPHPRGGLVALFSCSAAWACLSSMSLWRNEPEGHYPCPLLGVKRTLPGSAAMSASDPRFAWNSGPRARIYALTRYLAGTEPEMHHGRDYAFDHVHYSACNQKLLAHAGAAVDVQPVYLGRCAAAARPRGHGGLFHQRPYSVAANHSVGVDRRSSPRRDRHPLRLYDPLGGGAARLALSRHRVWHTSPRRRHGEHDALL